MNTSRARPGGWAIYLVLAACLAPAVVPTGPGRTGLIDPLNLLAIAAFAYSVVATRRPVQAPLLGPVILMSVGSVAATINAANPGAAILTIMQDAYLYVWLVALVNVLRGRGDFRGVRLAWVCAANVVAIIGIVQVLTHGGGSVLDLIKPKGARAVGTFDQPDTLADYLMMSIFMVLSLNEELGAVPRWGSIALMFTGMVATKANGGILSMMVGLIAWTIVRAWTRKVSYSALIGGALIVSSLAVVIVWLVVGLGVGSSQIGELQANSIAGRMGHSSEGRLKIWKSLQNRYLNSPMGIGPGNSRWQIVTIEERERPIVSASGVDPFLSKEAHNDYLAYLIERGPLGLLGMLLLKFQILRMIIQWWKRRSAGSREWVRGGALTAAFFGAWVASMVNSNTIETLHFRHVWLFLAMACTLGVREEGSSPAGVNEPAVELPVSGGARTVVVPAR